MDGGGGAHAGFRGAGGHSAGARSRFSSDVGVVGSASCSCAPFSAGGKDEATGSAVVLIGGSAAGRTSAAAELIWPPYVGAREITGGGCECDAWEEVEVERTREGRWRTNAKNARRPRRGC